MPALPADAVMVAKVRFEASATVVAVANVFGRAIDVSDAVTVVSLDTDTTGAELTELADGSETTLHSHAGGDGCVLVGSNVIGFDAPALDAKGIRRGEEIYDTHDLATLLLPGLPEYGLAALAGHFEIEMPVHHRALPDAETAHGIFLALADRGAALPADVLSQAAAWLAPTAWPWRNFFREAWEEVAAEGRAGRSFALSRPEIAEPLQPRERRRPIDPEEALAVLASARGRPEVLPQFEERPQQQAALRVVTQALNEEHRLLLEAGTGTGKELVIGFLIVLAFLIAVLGAYTLVFTMIWPAWTEAWELGLLYQAPLFIASIPLVGIARFRARRYRLSRTLWRGIRGAQSGSSTHYG
ncbi:hypothetical protein LCGC14_2946580, partial [marine sediment metagenome]